MRKWFDFSVTRSVRIEINSTILRKIDPADFASGAQELPGVVTDRQCYGVKSLSRNNLSKARRGHLNDVPGIGIKAAVGDGIWGHCFWSSYESRRSNVKHFSTGTDRYFCFPPVDSQIPLLIGYLTAIIRRISNLR